MRKFFNLIVILIPICLIALVLFNHYFNRTPDHTAISQSGYTKTSNLKKESVCGKDDKSPTHSDVDQQVWELIWHDEFESHCLDTSKWNKEDWAAEKNNELQYYAPDNIKVENGFLTLTSKKETFKGRNYTSGAVHTKGKFDFLYGKAEMRAKLPAGQGIFPAFWMMTDKEETWLPEIDIMEMLGHQPDEVWMVHHWLDKDGNLNNDSGSFQGPNFSTDFHTFSIEWAPNSITWFIDGKERFTSRRNIPDENMYLYLNTAVGGIWPGNPDHTTIFPVQFEIDYVRVFKKTRE